MYRKAYKAKVARYKKRQAPYRAKISSRVRRLENNVEYKFRDTDSGTLAPTLAGAILLLNGLAQGNDTDDRDGDQVEFTSIQIRFQARADTAGDENMIRVMLIQDRQTNGALPDVSDVLQKVTQFAILNSPLKLTNKFRFRVLYDRICEINDSGHNGVFKSSYKKLSVKARYTGATNAITDINTNSIFSIVIGNTTDGAYNFFVRLRFTDS